MDQKVVLSSSGTSGTGNRRPTSSGATGNPEASLPSRISPAKRTGYTTSASPLVEHTRRVAMEAMAHRTSVRMQVLEEAARSDQEGMIPHDESELRILRSFAQESPIYPDTATRKNVTVRRSRDRHSGLSSSVRTPEAITSRRSSIRDRDRRYSLESDPDRAPHEVPASLLPRRDGEELRGQYLDAAEPDHEFFFGEGAETGHATPHRIDYVEHLIGSGRKRNELKESRKKSSPEAQTESPHLLARSSSAQSPSRNLHLTVRCLNLRHIMRNRRN